MANLRTRSCTYLARNYECFGEISPLPHLSTPPPPRPLHQIPHGLDNFLYVHESYLSPRWLLDRPNVTLFTAESDCAVFCVSDPDVDVYDTERFPFVFFAHYQGRKNKPAQPILVPLES